MEDLKRYIKIPFLVPQKNLKCLASNLLCRKIVLIKDRPATYHKQNLSMYTD